MFKRLTFIALATLLILGQACVPENKSAGRRVSNEGAQGPTDPAPEPTADDASVSDAYWFSNGQIVNGNIIVNENSTDVIFLRGRSISNFLLNNPTTNDRPLCLVVSYNQAGTTAKKNLRLRALPVTFNNFSQNTVERLLRVDLSLRQDNQDTCNGEAFGFITSEGEPELSTPMINTSNSAFSLDQLCEDCNGIISSVRISLYKTRASQNLGSTSPQLELNFYVPASELNLKGLGLRVDIRNSVTDPVGDCSNSACSAKGFDCCIDGQCANDGVERPNASMQDDYNAAINDIIVNPLNFINYPEIFYVCPNVVRPDPDQPDALPDAEATANALLQREIEDFFCLEEGKKDSPDFSSLAIERCENFDEFVQIRAAVWDRCGCEADPFPADPFDPVCPDFGLRLVTDINGKVTQVQCLTPNPSVEPTPFQQLSLNVPNRSAPHRFFSEAGTNFDDISTITDPDIKAEGPEFFYLDESAKTEPTTDPDQAFSMNAILGQFSLSLNKALPAKVINVEFDRTYIIAARSGFYTPCPMCSKDSWFEAFTATPSSQRGSGLQAVGHTTTRDAYINNTTNGNYEDTIFGRACWVPPTMIPFTHRPLPNTTEQRRNRLEAQAALYVNGYQRDWYGFNKGALIGSFDGVKWFAIGNGRRITAQGNKLFLALNAPFADLTENTDTIVEIIADQSFDTVSDFDYDHDLLPNDPRQNSAGTCQSYHTCDVDSDCISKLGWEYACADVTKYRTRWPKFDINGNEIANDQFDALSFNQLLAGSQSDNNKRCVYRGAGAICKRDYNNNLDPLLKKQFACAPNFHCASFGDNSFNDKLVRTPQILGQILFGQGADVLGRPLQYVGAQNSLRNNIRANLLHNAQGLSSSAADFGICRPGRSLASNDILNRHSTSDSQNRADFISQIASCDSTATTAARINNCPVIETREGQSTQVGDIILSNDSGNLGREQNMCGGESQRFTGTGFIESTFKEIEAPRLQSLFDLLTPSLAADACLRRAGSICHTDLDCGPNRLHANQAAFFGPSMFGNSNAEKKFWEEALVCGQDRKLPFLQDEDYFEYDLTENRCCRATGQELTMYSRVNNESFSPGIGIENINLNVVVSGLDAPSADKRYSRYTSIDFENLIPGFGSFGYQKELGYGVPFAPIPSNLSPFGHLYQWKTINDTGKENCCGGGFIRKFADSTTDWGNINRLFINPEELKCLNYTNPLVLNRDMAAAFPNLENYDREYDRLCRAPADGGCVQVAIEENNAFELVAPDLVSTAPATVNTLPLNQTALACGGQQQELNSDVPYMPVPYRFNSLQDCPLNYILNEGFKFTASMYLPLYILSDQAIRDHASDFVVDLRNEEEENIAVVGLNECSNQVRNTLNNFDDDQEARRIYINNIPPADVNDPLITYPNYTWCVVPENGNLGGPLVLHVRTDHDIDVAFPEYAFGGFSFQFTKASNLLPSFNGSLSTNPGNDLYYLTKLARLELLGIPQIFYEPLYCNDDRNKLVRGIFNNETRTSFEANAQDYSNVASSNFLLDIYNSSGSTDSANPSGKIVYQNEIKLPQIFSGHEFRCCSMLGKEVQSADQCCSGFAVDEEDKLICKLKRNTNLNVYFNRFVSSEGAGIDLPLGGLTDADFIAETGEPKLQSSTYNKLSALGALFCEGESVRRGSTTGTFDGEPYSGFYQQIGPITDSKRYSFIDSIRDADVESDRGTIRFFEGLRWSHHFYCQ